MKSYIKIITGFDDDQKHTINSDEAHKAYYLFMNPEKRGMFNNGLAIIGKDIKTILPDYNATMGWNATHELDGDDWNDIRKKGVDIILRDIIQGAKEISYLVNKNPHFINEKLSEINLKLPSSRELKP